MVPLTTAPHYTGSVRFCSDSSSPLLYFHRTMAAPTINAIRSPDAFRGLDSLVDLACKTVDRYWPVSKRAKNAAKKQKPARKTA